MTGIHRLVVAGAVLAGGILLAGCGSTTVPATPATPSTGRSAYAGSEACRPCHAEQYAEEHEQSGHPYKLVRVTNGVAPQYPEQVVRGPYQPMTTTPTGLTWADAAYVIGGYGWKGRFVDQQGFVVTGTGIQWNIRARTWGNYEPDTPRGEKKYDYACFKCHTTGAEDGTDDLSTHQDGRLGMQGTFAEAGIGCESCHGPGAEHVVRPSTENIVYDAGSDPAGLAPTGRMIVNEDDNAPPVYRDLGRAAGSRQASTYRAMTCGDCHTRNGVGQIAASGGFVQHHEQFDELMAGGAHRSHDCITCHDPHRGEIYGDAGLNKNCQSCHGQKSVDHAPGATCVDCHMPYTGKSATNSSPYKADVHSHIVRIRTTTETKAAYFNAAGNRVALDSAGNAALTLDFACYGCHKDADGKGGTGSAKTMGELAAKAVTIHG